MTNDAPSREPVDGYRPISAPRGDAPFRAIRRPRANMTQPMILIHGVERRIRALGYEPVRTFDNRKGWRLEVNEETIATGRSLSEAARSAAEWLARRESGEGTRPTS